MIRLEQLADGTVADRNFQALMRLVPDTGGQTVGFRFGVTQITFTASTNSADTIVSHGLGRTPVVGFAQPYNSPLFGKIPTTNLYLFGASTFRVNGEVDSAHTGDISILWLVIG